MKKALIEFARTHLVIILGFIALTLIYMYPLLEGKVLSQHDMLQVKGMSQEMREFHEETGAYSQWTNSMFGGMPGFHVGPTGARTTIFRMLGNILRLGTGFVSPFGNLFVYMISFYVLLLALRLNHWTSAIGAVAFALSSYNIIIIEVGHINKVYAIAFMAPVVAGMLLAYRGKYMGGGLLFMVGLGLQLYSNHLQITYYLLLLAVIIVITKLAFAILNWEIRKFMIASGVLAAGAILALLPNVSTLWVNYSIAKQSMRGEPVLTMNRENQTSGLDIDYALAWSYGKSETFSLMIPYVKGGKTGALGENPKAMEQVSPAYRETVAQQNMYWGPKAVTSGDNYAGAIVVFFFVLGLFLIRGPMRWWIIISTILSIFMAWGKFFPSFSHFLLDHVPLYNKFRTVEMALVIAGFNIPLMAFLVIDRIRKEPGVLVENRRRMLIAFGLTGGLSLLFYLFPGLFSFFSEREEQMFQQQLAGASAQYASQLRTLMDEMEGARKYIFRFDAMRSFLFISAAFGLAWFYAGKKLKLEWFMAGLGFLVIIDLWLIDRRYLDSDNFITPRQQQGQIAATTADEAILRDPDPHYRVANLTLSPFQDATTSYYHKSIGGYHGAKLQRYQDLIEYHISPELQDLVQVLNRRPPDVAAVDSVLAEMTVLNMLNTKYFILNRDGQPLLNPFAVGHAWIVNDYRVVESPDEMILALNNVNLEQTALVEEQFSGLLSDELRHEQAEGSVELTEYRPNYLSYKVNLSKPSLVVFSDIYYEGGWHAAIDGEPVDHLRANYILRALPVEAGEHTIEFEFVFRPFELGERISLAGSLLVSLGLLLSLGYYLKRGDWKPRA